MCFTIEIKLTRDALEKRFNADSAVLEDFEFRYFYRAFDKPLLPVITQQAPTSIVLAQWGLIPHWAQDMEQAKKISSGTYNARGETLNERSSFKKAFQQSRCWVLVNGFFEWQTVGKEKIPWYINRADNRPFAIAGICDIWQDPDNGRELKTCSIVTTRANNMMEKIHNTKKRMPLILPEPDEEKWISRGINTDQHSKLIKPLEEGVLKAHTIHKKIGNRGTDPDDSSVILPFNYTRDNTLFD